MNTNSVRARSRSGGYIHYHNHYYYYYFLLCHFCLSTLLLLFWRGRGSEGAHLRGDWSPRRVGVKGAWHRDGHSLTHSHQPCCPGRAATTRVGGPRRRRASWRRSGSRRQGWASALPFTVRRMTSRAPAQRRMAPKSLEWKPTPQGPSSVARRRLSAPHDESPRHAMNSNHERLPRHRPARLSPRCGSRESSSPPDNPSPPLPPTALSSSKREKTGELREASKTNAKWLQRDCKAREEHQLISSRLKSRSILGVFSPQTKKKKKKMYFKTKKIIES